MSKPILYGAMMSGPTRSVLLTAKAIGIELEFKELNLLKGEQMSEEFIKINPQHVIPTLVDEGKSIWESAAINTYLIGKYASDDLLYPKDLYKRAVVDQRLFYNCTVLAMAGGTIARNVIMRGQTKISDEEEEAVIKCYSTLELFLQNGNFMTGDSMTVADFTCITHLSSMKELVPIDSKTFSKLVAYVDRMFQLPYFEGINSAATDMFVNFVKKAMKDNIRKSFDSK